MTDNKAPTDRTRVRRVPARANHERDTIYSILDEALVCHVGFVADRSPNVLPMAMARNGDELLLHGSTASRLMRTLAAGTEVSVAVTHLDGVVVARSAFHSSMNYRSAVVYGRARAVTDRAEKLEALEIITNHLIPGRWDELRPPTGTELKATFVLSVPLEESVAKIRTGPPKDDAKDLDAPVWAGVVPLRPQHSDPVPDDYVQDGLPLPASVARLLARFQRHAASRVTRSPEKQP